MTTKQLKPMRINSNQITRLLRGQIGTGFLSYRFDETSVEVAEFQIGPAGELLNPSGTPLTYYGKVGDLDMRYRVVSEPMDGAEITPVPLRESGNGL